MKRLLTTAAALGLTAALAACGGQADTETAEARAAAETAAPAGNTAMDGMNMAPAGSAQTVRSTGTVTAVDPAAGTVTIDHAPIPEANWPAMTMGFKASPAVAQRVAVGDKVAFDLKLENGGGEITAIQKQ
ncbi:MAG TPA: copper-binding protein [Phenylobacterium sp.]|jgi:Cu/Ag efflux protein CusF|uniref:copper-binding protein n=1 Tax=Phenylobacterium sp. TaxID=1871053 RepID=UPI002F9332AF